MDQIKEAFNKVKEEVASLKKELLSLRGGIVQDRQKINEICSIINQLNNQTKIIFQKQKDLEESLIQILQEGQSIKKDKESCHSKTSPLTTFTQNIDSTQKQENSTIPTHNPTPQHIFKPLNDQILVSSSGNEGVPTDRQTDRQTDEKQGKDSYNTIANAIDIINSLDNLKKEIRLKFKKLTDQEVLIFSTLYQLEEEQGHSDYKTLSIKLNLTESSIRDYIGRLIKKGIPVDKEKINNKTIHLKISKNLKKVASLDTLLKLREL